MLPSTAVSFFSTSEARLEPEIIAFQRSPIFNELVLILGELFLRSVLMIETVSEKVILGFLVMEGRIRELILLREAAVVKPLSEFSSMAVDSVSLLSVSFFCCSKLYVDFVFLLSFRNFMLGLLEAAE